MKATIKVNGEAFEVDAAPSRSLADVLRDYLELTGTKRGCDSGGCGMCTLLLDGKIVFSCMTPWWRVQGKEVMTVEGLGKSDLLLHPLQRAFVETSAPQCGYCTSAMLLAGKDLLDSNPDPTEEEIRSAICGVLCRCTGYIPYIRAIQEASRIMKTEVPSFG